MALAMLRSMPELNDIPIVQEGSHTFFIDGSFKLDESIFVCCKLVIPNNRSASRVDHLKRPTGFFLKAIDEHFDRHVISRNNSGQS